MCLPIAKYKRIMIDLETVVYPSLIKQVDEILIGFQNVPEHQSPVQLEKIQLTIDLKTELSSLRSYEIRLIFPQVVSLLNHKNDIAAVKIDFNQVAQLANFKEEKIEKYSYQLQGLNNCHETVMGNSNIVSGMVDIFLDDIQTKLLPLKRQWGFMLTTLANESKGLNRQCGNTLNAHCGGSCKNEKKLLVNN
ncbi:MAG TPA: hypothetical protein VK559_05635 [Ferruginibacter sp.]|nr:hypothetical protein [Ferruginibacter sp.]